jgi:hypothetical protein
VEERRRHRKERKMKIWEEERRRTRIDKEEKCVFNWDLF